MEVEHVASCISTIAPLVSIRSCNGHKLIATPINLGTSLFVTVNELVEIIEEIGGIKLQRTYKLDAPKGVGGRNSDNTFIKSILNWEPKIPLMEGLQYIPMLG